MNALVLWCMLKVLKIDLLDWNLGYNLIFWKLGERDKMMWLNRCSVCVSFSCSQNQTWGGVLSLVSLLCSVLWEESDGNGAFTLTDCQQLPARESICGYSSTPESSLCWPCHLGVAQPPSAQCLASSSQGVEVWLLLPCNRSGRKQRQQFLVDTKAWRKWAPVITESTGFFLKRPLRSSPIFDPTPPCVVTHLCWHHLVLWSNWQHCAKSSLSLNTYRNSDSITSLSSPFQYLITLCVKKLFLMCSLNSSWCSLRLVLSCCWLPGRIGQHLSGKYNG